MEWISTLDRLPQSNTQCFVIVGGYAQERICTFKDGVFYRHGDNGREEVYPFMPDYWMKIELPKETEDNPLIEMHLSVDPGMADSIEETE